MRHVVGQGFLFGGRQETDCDCLLFSETVHKHAYSDASSTVSGRSAKTQASPVWISVLGRQKLSDLQPYTRRLLLVTDSILLLSPSITTHRPVSPHLGLTECEC